MTRAADAQLDELIARIRRLAHSPEDVGGPFRFLTRPFHRVFSRKPQLSVERIGALLRELNAASPEPDRLRLCLAEAVEELDDDVDALERACIADGKPPAAHLLWLWRVYGVVACAAQAIEDGDREGYRVAGARDPRILVEPLTTTAPVDAEGRERIAPIALVDALLDTARAEPDHLGRRRRLVEAARHALLEASVAVDLDEDAALARREWMAREIQAINALEAAGLRADVGLLHQAKRALSHGDQQTLHATLRGLDGIATSRGDLSLGRITGRALTAFDRRSPQAAGGPGRRADAVAATARRALGGDVEKAISEGYVRARSNLAVRAKERSGVVRRHLDDARGYIDDSAAVEQLLATFGVDGAVVRYNTFYRPGKWVMRILQETTEPGFVPCRNGRFEHNIVVFRRADVSTFVNVGSNTAPETFTFADNLWYCEDRPQASKPTLPTPETGGIYGVDPQFADPEKNDFKPRSGRAAGFGASALKRVGQGLP